MLDLLLDIVPGTGDKASGFYFDNYGEPFVYALIGFLIVFAGIVLIIAIIWLLGLLMRKTDNLAFLRKGNKNKPEPVNTCEKADDGLPDEVKVAVIAAVTAYMDDEKPGCEFKIKKIKRL